MGELSRLATYKYTHFESQHAIMEEHWESWPAAFCVLSRSDSANSNGRPLSDGDRRLAGISHI